MQDARELKPGGRYENNPGEYAMHKFAYYLCFKCQVSLLLAHKRAERERERERERQRERARARERERDT